SPPGNTHCYSNLQLEQPVPGMGRSVSYYSLHLSPPVISRSLSWDEYVERHYEVDVFQPVVGPEQYGLLLYARQYRVSIGRGCLARSLLISPLSHLYNDKL